MWHTIESGTRNKEVYFSLDCIESTKEFYYPKLEHFSLKRKRISKCWKNVIATIEAS